MVRGRFFGFLSFQPAKIVVSSIVLKVVVGMLPEIEGCISDFADVRSYMTLKYLTILEKNYTVKTLHLWKSNARNWSNLSKEMESKVSK